MKRQPTVISGSVDAYNFPKTPKVQITHEDIEEFIENKDKDPDRMWETRVIFGVTKPTNGSVAGRRQVGIFIFSPLRPDLTKIEEERKLLLPNYLEAEVQTREHLQEIQKDLGRVYRQEIYTIDPGPSGVEHITPEALIERALRLWKEYPIQTNGYIELAYPPSITVIATRNDLLKENTREALLTHTRKILEFMRRGFKWDPWAGKEGALRRIGHEGIGPWAKKR